MEVIQVDSVEEMNTAVEAVLARVSTTQTAGAVVIALSGELGAGKTTFVQALARALGVEEAVTSPTYVVMKTYPLEGEKLSAPLRDVTKLVHIDAYRIEELDEMRVLGFSELLAEKNTMMCIEWPEHIAALLPGDSIKVSLALAGRGRVVTIL